MKSETDFFEKLKPFSNLLSALCLIGLHYNELVELYSLSIVYGEPDKSNVSVQGKNKWADCHMPFVVPSHRIYVKSGVSKTAYIKGGISKNDILLDDYTANLRDWEDHGGHGIKIRNNINCKNGIWKGQIIYNQDDIPVIISKLDAIISSTLTSNNNHIYS